MAPHGGSHKGDDNIMREMQLAEGVLDVMSAWAERTPQVLALWVTGSFATATADHFSDIDLRGCIEPEDFDYFASVESALSALKNWEVLKRREFSDDRLDSEMVIVLGGGLWRDVTGKLVRVRRLVEEQ